MTTRNVALAMVTLASFVLLASNSVAQVVMYNGVGSSAMFNTFAFAARLGTSPVCGTGGTAHNWTKKNGASVHDARSASISDVTGNIWIVWDNSTAPTNICAYLNVDSGVGDRAFFAVPTATIVLDPADNGSTGDNLVPTPMPADESLPSAVFNALNGAVFNAAMTDIRPEDALFATNRAMAPLTTNRSGLGYGPPPIGVPIQSAFSTKSVLPVGFAITGTDPISGRPARGNFLTTNIGACPVVVFVNKTNHLSGHLGNALFTNANRFVLASVLGGPQTTYVSLTRTRDLVPTMGLPSVGLHVLLREPLSGTYNTMEFNVPNSKEIASSQEIGVVPPGDNPLNQTYASGGSRQRVVGTGEMVSEVVNIPDSLGYAFWSFGNFASAVSTTKYLAVDGVDPIRASYSNGTFPTCPTPPCTGLLTFPNIKNGTYPIWSILRIVTANPIPTGILSLIGAAISDATTIPDFVPATQLFVFRSHYNQVGIVGANGHKSPERGGDVGGAVYTVQADLDSITDTGLEILGRKQ
jgi:ABC-type phosphate transport system substrate-binding protein